MNKLAIFALAFAVVCLPAPAGTNKHSADLDAVTSGDLHVIITFVQKPGSAHVRKIRSAGGTTERLLDAVNGVAATIPVQALLDLESDPAVRYVTLDRAVHPTLDYTTAAVNDNVAFQSGYTGTSIGVAIVDSGVSPHPDLNDANGNSRIVYNESFVSGDTSTGDEYGHGTHVAGIAAGNGASSTGLQYTHTFRGLAPSAQIVNLKVLNANGAGTDSAVIAAIGRAIQLKSTYNIRVLNLSLGRPVFESFRLDPLCQAVEAAWKAGIVVVVAAGNDGRNNTYGNNGYGTINSPGNDPCVITVGAMKTEGTYPSGDDLIASYSSKGPTLFDHVVKPDLVAPGNRVISDVDSKSELAKHYNGNLIQKAYYSSSPGKSDSKLYFRLSGTSMATPVVSGSAILMLQQSPQLSPDSVKARMMKTATKNFPVSSVAVDPVTNISYTSQYDIFTIGAGYLDVWAALNNTDAVNGAALSPAVLYNPLTGATALNLSGPGGATIIWGTSGPWSTSAIWGTNVFVDGQTIIWGTNVAWGTSTTQAFSAIWGTTIIWGTSTGLSNSEAIAINGEQ
ncbi:MAG TPA: S8 family peptidase [Bryobacteraceae bacterium]|nr:S8 family peptidase [Bryobacteraceae bacterium]